jgi:hypothetical protein
MFSRFMGNWVAAFRDTVTPSGTLNVAILQEGWIEGGVHNRTLGVVVKVQGLIAEPGLVFVTFEHTNNLVIPAKGKIEIDVDGYLHVNLLRSSSLGQFGPLSLLLTRA